MRSTPGIVVNIKSEIEHPKLSLGRSEKSEITLNPKSKIKLIFAKTYY